MDKQVRYMLWSVVLNWIGIYNTAHHGGLYFFCMCPFVVCMCQFFTQSKVAHTDVFLEITHMISLPQYFYNRAHLLLALGWQKEKKLLPGSEECSLTTTEVLAHYAAVTNLPATQMGNIPSWSMTAYQVLPSLLYLIFGISNVRGERILSMYLLHVIKSN